jgi:hypothetical protein
MEQVQLTQEELQKINSFRQTYDNIRVRLGSVELDLNRLGKIKEDLLAANADTVEQEQAFVKELNEKYGEGSIDLATGTFTPTPAPQEEVEKVEVEDAN